MQTKTLKSVCRFYCVSSSLFSTPTLHSPLLKKKHKFAIHSYKRNGKGLEKGNFVTVMGSKQNLLYLYT